MIDDVENAGRFLHEHMSDRFSPAEWTAGLLASWSEDAPNYGYMLEDGGTVVGMLCALYSEQRVGDQLEKFCNPHT